MKPSVIIVGSDYGGLEKVVVIKHGTETENRVRAIATFNQMVIAYIDERLADMDEDQGGMMALRNQMIEDGTFVPGEKLYDRDSNGYYIRVFHDINVENILVTSLTG